jgi:hypothetical protein
MKTVLLEELVFLECILAGYIPGNKDIQWFFNGEMLRNSEKYTIFDSSDTVCTYGTCQHSPLLIRLPNANDVGTYTCSYENLSERISVVTRPPPFPTPGLSSVTPPPTQTNTPSAGSEPLVIAGLTAAGYVLVLTGVAIFAIAAVCVVMKRHKSLPQNPLEQPMYDYIGPPDPTMELKENVAYGQIQLQPCGPLTHSNQTPSGTEVTESTGPTPTALHSNQTLNRPAASEEYEIPEPEFI